MAQTGIAQSPQMARTRGAWRRYATHQMFVTGFVLCLFVVLMAVFADVLATRSPERTRISQTFQPPSETYLMGTDNLGRDVWSRVVHGSRVSILIGLATVVLAGIAGTLVGLLAGFYRRLD